MGYLFDIHGKRYIDWTSQAVCANMGHTVPENVIEATMKQMRTLPYIYGGLGISEIRARMSQFMAEIMPGDLEGMVFPSSGSEANEAAIMMARRYTGKFKVLSFYRSYHGCTGNALQATGDFRRATFGGDHIPGFVKMFNQYPLYWEHEGGSDEEKCKNALNMLEEQILYEGPDTIACLTMEPVVGARGVLIPSTQYMQGVRSLCAYENLKHLIKEDIIGNVQRNEQRFENYMRMLAENHPSIKQYRAIGYFGAFDIHTPDGNIPGPAEDAAFVEYRKAFTQNGLMALVRPPHIHVAPPLITTEEQLLDGFDRQDNALFYLDEALGY